MKSTIMATSGVLTLAMTMSLPATADNHAQPNLTPVELYSCTFKEGKNMADLNKLDAKFKKWADKNNKDHSSWRIVPILRSLPEPFDVGYIGSWNSGAAMGAGMDAWGANTDLLAEYQATIDCGHSLLASAEVNAPDGPPKDGVVWFASCNVQESASDKIAYAAHKKMSGAMRKLGSKAQSWLFYPSLGMGDVSFDYYSVVTFNSMAELGEGWDMYYNKGGWKKANMMDAVTDCDSPRVYQVEAIRTGPRG